MCSSVSPGVRCVSDAVKASDIEHVEGLNASRHIVAVAFRAQLSAFRRAPVTTLLTVLLPVNLPLLLSLFALTGYKAPTALVMDEHTPTAQAFVDALRDSHHSFDLRPMSLQKANRQLDRGQIVAVLHIPAGFEEQVRGLDQGFVTMRIDNVNVDLAEDVRRALRAAAVIFG